MSIPEEQEIKRTLEMFERSENWFSDNYKELEKEYLDMILAIRDEKVISASATIEELLENLKARNEDISSVYIGSISPKGIAFIL